jgi:hypothetical protein
VYNHQALCVLGVIALREREVSHANRAFKMALEQAAISLGRCSRHFDALYSQGLARCGLAVCESDEAYITKAAADFEAAKLINSDIIILQRARRLLDQIEKVDSTGLIISHLDSFC